jgi:pimeloyl-ACP methyl ester carboxylesterase
MDTYADDLAWLFNALDLSGAILVGHSSGSGEVARYIGRHGTKRLHGRGTRVRPRVPRQHLDPGDGYIGAIGSGPLDRSSSTGIVRILVASWTRTSHSAPCREKKSFTA